MQVIIFTSKTCGPCKVVKPLLMGAAITHGFACSEVEAGPATQQTFFENGVRQVPTVIVRNGDSEVARFTGAATAQMIEAFLKEHGVI